MAPNPMRMTPDNMLDHYLMMELPSPASQSFGWEVPTVQVTSAVHASAFPPIASLEGLNPREPEMIKKKEKQFPDPLSILWTSGYHHSSA